MIIQTVAGTRTLSGEPPRSTAYYYADLERIKRQNGDATQNGCHVEPRQNPDELSEYVEANDVVNDGAIKEVPPFRDRLYSLPEYTTPENSRKLETYSTAGTFPMPEPKEKEPLLAELEIVGRVPLTQLDNSSGVRRSRSWYLCCPNVEDEEMSRESSWRYSSLRPVTAPPMSGQNGMNTMTATQSSGRDDVLSLKAERDALSRALAAERARAAAAARAQDARLAELHGVIAELVRRRAGDRQNNAIPEEEPSDECESTTQPAGELDNDADRSRTDQNDTSSILSGAELTGEESRTEELPHEDNDDDTHPAECPQLQELVEADSSLNLSEKESEVCVAGRWYSGGSCDRERGSSEGNRVCTASPVCCEMRKAKLAARVRLKKMEEHEPDKHISNEERWWLAAERLARDVCAQSVYSEGQAGEHDTLSSKELRWWRARCARLESDAALLHMALSRATHTAHRLSCACAVQESSSVALCSALRAADRALETYDVLLALAETQARDTEQREAAESVAKQLLAKLEMELDSCSLGEPLLSPGPWLLHNQLNNSEGEWSGESEARLRSHAARLKAESVRLRTLAPPPQLFSCHDIEEEELSKSQDSVSVAEMEAAVMMQELLAAREKRALEALRQRDETTAASRTNDTSKSRRRREKKQWHAETDL